jgi:hypothetical protein
LDEIADGYAGTRPELADVFSEWTVGNERNDLRRDEQ